jgi:2'-5' RNA ligase
VRLFLALNLPAAVRDAVHAAYAPLREVAPAAAWTAPDKLHLTVKFVGEQPREMADALAAAATRVAAGHAPVVLELAHFGAFPNRRRPRVLWLGVRADPRLELLHHDVELACAELGLPVDGRAFRPHVTLGRVRPAGPPVDPRALAHAARAVHFREEVTVETLDLMLSEPAHGGTRYTPLARAPLAGVPRPH